MLFVHVLDYISIYSLTDKIFFFIKDPLAALQLIFGWGKYKNVFDKALFEICCLFYDSSKGRCLLMQAG